ncbi:unnamed protein product [Linum trigynum]|uniref:Uncharacterized protein n=1 Tax=Linum trigynum TaxID=586398 RepID=A0AAV2DWW9_9ROSI
MINWLLGLVVCSGKEIFLYVCDVDALEQGEGDLSWDQHGGVELLDLSLVAGPQSPLAKEEKRNGRAAKHGRLDLSPVLGCRLASFVSRTRGCSSAGCWSQVARGEEKRRGRAGEEKTMKAPSRFTSIRD